MTVLRRIACLLFLVALGLPAVANPRSVVDKSFAQLVAEADHIFLGTVTAITGRRLASGAIVSDVALIDIVAVKGADPPRVLTVLGGVLDGEEMQVSGVPTFRPGQRYLLFERNNGRDAFPFVGGAQGVFQIETDAGGTALVADAFGRVVMVEPPDGGGPGLVRLTLPMFLGAIQQQLMSGS